MNSGTRDSIQDTEPRLAELEKVCFVIMPFGKKKVGRRQVDFTQLYREVFAPAIESATTPEGENLVAKRTDMDAFSSSINQEMFEYIMYSRLAFADISGLNPNVFYEIGARHSVQKAGTVLFRQKGHVIPFDIQTIKVFEYDYQSGVDAASAFITEVLTETLKRNRLDSPVRLALRAQRGDLARRGSDKSPGTGSESRHEAAPGAGISAAAERFMHDAEEALRLRDRELARINYWAALRLDPLNVIARMRLGMLLKERGENHDALEEFVTLTKIAPDYGEAWKEKGIAEGLIARSIDVGARPAGLKDGVASLQRAAQLIPDDFDVWASLGGVFKNVRGDLDEAHRMYARAVEISDGHPYPLLNSLKLEAKQTGKLDLKSAQAALTAAEGVRRAQTWSFFDLAELRLYQNDKAGFLENVREGIKYCEADWQPKTFRKSLNDMLVEAGIDLPGLGDGIALLDDAANDLARS
jgi:tetratricopeptide (TPR) repeat protein